MKQINLYDAYLKSFWIVTDFHTTKFCKEGKGTFMTELDFLKIRLFIGFIEILKNVKSYED